WDKGSYSALKEKASLDDEKLLKAGLKAGNLKFVLKGKKLKGEFALVKLKNNKAGDNSWLLIKHNDDFAVHNNYNSEEETSANSPINKWMDANKAPAKKKAQSKK
ncbi:MAG: 3'-phosphoesterase, partial [Ferruginibacter sp.]